MFHSLILAGVRQHYIPTISTEMEQLHRSCVWSRYRTDPSGCMLSLLFLRSTPFNERLSTN